MRVLFMLVFFSWSSFALADVCHDRFTELLTDTDDKGPIKIHAVQDIKGGMKTTSHFYQTEVGHWMTEMIEPENMQWTLVHNNIMYSSSDKGESWNKIQELDSQQNNQNTSNKLVEDAKTARNTECGSEELDGVLHEKVKGTYDSTGSFAMENTSTYWVVPETGWITKAIYEIKASAFESTTIQIIERAPGLELPTPQ